MHPPLPQCLLLAGPTAVGKSDVALALAEKLPGEIISVDSMQVYRGLDIGTAKPSLEYRARVPHHLIDVVDVSEPFDAAQFLRRARESVAQIVSRRRVPILCGGTGLYFKAFLYGLGSAPPANLDLRKELEVLPIRELLRELAEADPVGYEQIDRNNRRRVVRAIEIIRLSGKPFSLQRADWRLTKRNDAALSFAIARSSADLHRRIDSRVDDMFRLGLVAETEQLLKRGLAQNQTAMQALGYRQVVEHLRDERSFPETVELVKVRTRQFAKRQMTWFRHQLPLNWLALEPADTVNSVADRILADWQVFQRQSAARAHSEGNPQ